MRAFKRVHIFSDLHLTSLEESLGLSFLQAMRNLQGSEDALVLAGDIFEVLVGDSKYFRKKISNFLAVLEHLLAQGVSIFYLEGNHDFHLSRLLPSGVQISQDSVRIPVVGVSGSTKIIEVAHGDLVDAEDHAYLRMRSFFRSTTVRWAVEWIPGRMIAAIASILARDHLQKSKQLPESWSEESRNRLRALYHADAEKRRSRGADFVVMGHCHDLDAWGGFYWNMGYPPVHRQYLVYDPFGRDGKESIDRRYFLGK